MKERVISIQRNLIPFYLMFALSGCGSAVAHAPGREEPPTATWNSPLCTRVKEGDQASNLATRAGVPQGAIWEVTTKSIVNGIPQMESFRIDTVYADDLQAPGTVVDDNGNVVSYVQEVCFYHKP